MLSGVQQRNLELAWGRPVVDRVGLIIEIFAQRARTREARLQVAGPGGVTETHKPLDNLSKRVAPGALMSWRSTSVGRLSDRAPTYPIRGTSQSRSCTAEGATLSRMGLCSSNAGFS